MTATRSHRSHTERNASWVSSFASWGLPVSTNDARRRRRCCSAKNSSKETGCSTRAWCGDPDPDATGVCIYPMNAVSMCFVQNDLPSLERSRDEYRQNDLGAPQRFCLHVLCVDLPE